MLPEILVPETEVHEAGVSPTFRLDGPVEQPVLLTLEITHIVEQESLDISIWESPNGEDWGARPLLSLPRKFYTGTYGALLRLQPGIRYLRAMWDVKRWGRGELKPFFVFRLRAKPVSTEITPQMLTRAVRAG